MSKKMKVHLGEIVAWFLAFSMLDTMLSQSPLQALMMIAIIATAICVVSDDSWTETAIRHAGRKIKARIATARAARATKAANQPAPVEPVPAAQAANPVAETRPFVTTEDPHRVN